MRIFIFIFIIRWPFRYWIYTSEKRDGKKEEEKKEKECVRGKEQGTRVDFSKSI